MEGEEVAICSNRAGLPRGSLPRMEMLSPRAFGFRDFENYRLWVLAQCSWNGKMNRVWLVPIPRLWGRTLYAA